MKRRLFTSVCGSPAGLALAVIAGAFALAACQIDGSERIEGSEGIEDTSEVSQHAGTCGDRLPELETWKDQRPPATRDGQIYLLFEDGEKSGQWIAVLVDYENEKIPLGFRFRAASVASFVSALDKVAQFAGGRTPTPPQPVGDDWNLFKALIGWAKVAAGDKAVAEERGLCFF